MKPAGRQLPTVTVKVSKAAEFDIPSYLRTSWTSNENSKFGEILNVLRQGGFTDSDSSTDDYYLGLRTVFAKLANPTSCMQIMCVIACIDNGKDSGVTARLARDCFTNGVPLILGRGPRQLGSVFGKKRVVCVALSKQAASRSGLLDLIMNMSAVSSTVSIPLEETDDVKERWLSVASRFREGLSVPAPKRKTPDASLPPPAKKPKQQQNSQHFPKKATPKKATPKKGSFFSSFD